MADGSADKIGIEPDMWFLIFQTKARTRWLRWIALGRFKHVSAIGWLSDQRAWVVYNVELDRTRVAVLPDSPGASDLIAEMRQGAEMVAMAPGPEHARWLRLGFWCVPAMSHLVGLKRTVFRPDALYRACLAQGGAVVDW